MERKDARTHEEKMGRKRINIKTVFTKIMALSIVITFIHCASGQTTIDTEMPVIIKNPYFQKWDSPIQEGGSGFTVYIPVEKNTEIVLDSIYFKGKRIRLLPQQGGIVYQGTYTYPGTKDDFIMSADPKEEFKNKIPVIEEKIPFVLKEGEGMIQYTKNGKKGYFSVSHIPKKEDEGFPMNIRQ